MSRQAVVGLFTILGLVALFVVYFILSDLATRASGYETGVHFSSAAGLTRGSLVYESGVQVGTVREIRLLDDFTVSVVMAIKGNVDIPRDSQFIISAPLTGSSTLTIVPPKLHRATLALLPREVLPVEQQPRGSNPVSVSDLLQAGQGELVKFDALLTDLSKREPKLMAQLQSAIANANDLAVTANGAMQRFAKRGDELTVSLQRSLDAASSNIVDLTGRLNDTMRKNSGRVDTLMVSLNQTATSLADATASLQRLATNQDVHANLIETTRQIATTTRNIADLTADLRSITGDPNTQAQMKNTVANVDAAMQRVTSILGALGGTSSVYGVDAGVTPAPASSSSSAPVPVSAPSGTRGRGGEVRFPPRLRERFGELAKSLVEVQIRISALSKQAANAQNNTLLNRDTGPQSDANLILLPKADTRLLGGVNDLSANQTWNLALQQKVARGTFIGGGILYSRLGVLGSVSNGAFGFEGRAYDVRHPYLDAYLHARATKNFDFFVGERDIVHPERRTVFGLQYEFLGGK